MVYGVIIHKRDIYNISPLQGFRNIIEEWNRKTEEPEVRKDQNKTVSLEQRTIEYMNSQHRWSLVQDLLKILLLNSPAWKEYVLIIWSEELLAFGYCS